MKRTIATLDNLTVGSLKELIKDLPDNTPIGGVGHFGEREDCNISVLTEDNPNNDGYNKPWIGIYYYIGEGPD